MKYFYRIAITTMLVFMLLPLSLASAIVIGNNELGSFQLSNSASQYSYSLPLIGEQRNYTMYVPNDLNTAKLEVSTQFESASISVNGGSSFTHQATLPTVALSNPINVITVDVEYPAQNIKHYTLLILKPSVLKGIHVDNIVQYVNNAPKDVNGDQLFNNADIEYLLNYLDPYSVEALTSSMPLLQNISFNNYSESPELVVECPQNNTVYRLYSSLTDPHEFAAASWSDGNVVFTIPSEAASTRLYLTAQENGKKESARLAISQLGTISATVFDEFDAPMSGATVTLLDGEGNAIPNVPPVLTDADGNYAFTDVPLGWVHVEIAQEGYFTASQSYEILRGSNIEDDYYMNSTATSTKILSTVDEVSGDGNYDIHFNGDGEGYWILSWHKEINESITVGDLLNDIIKVNPGQTLVVERDGVPVNTSALLNFEDELVVTSAKNENIMRYVINPTFIYY